MSSQVQQSNWERRLEEVEGRTKAAWRLLSIPKLAPKVNENRLWDEINALKTRVQVLGQSLERLGQRVSVGGHQQSGLATADNGKGEQETNLSLVTLYDSPSPTKAKHPTSDECKEPSRRYKPITVDAGTQNGCPECGDKEVTSSRGGQQASDSATADKAGEKLESNVTEKPAPAADAASDSSSIEEEEVDFYSGCRSQ